VIDFRKDRVYLPLSTLASCGLDPQQLGVEIESGDSPLQPGGQSPSKLRARAGSCSPAGAC
jgi:hypothetical protein